MAFKNGLAKVGKVWHYRFQRGGKEFYGSTGTDLLGDAKAILAEKKRQVGRVRGRIADPDMTLGEAFRAWQGARKGNGPPGREDRHLQASEWAAVAFLELAHTQLRDLTPAALARWRGRFLGDGAREASSANLALRYLRLVLNWAVGEGYLRGVPFKVKVPQNPKKRRPVVRADLVVAFLRAFDACTQSRAKRVGVRCVFGLGIRMGELRRLDWAWFQIDPAGWTCWVPAAVAKDGDAREIPVPSWLQGILARWKGDRAVGLVFPARDGLPHRSGWLDRNTRRAAVAIGLPPMGIHRVRATFGSLLAGAGTPMSEVRDLYGHEDLKTTQIYVQSSSRVAREGQEKVAGLVGLVGDIVEKGLDPPRKKKKTGMLQDRCDYS